MGSLLNRSSSVRPERRKTKWGKGKRKRLDKMETSTESEKFPVQNDHEEKNPNETLMNTYDEWNKRMDQQQQIANMNGDPPGAPRTYSTSFPMVQNDLMSQSWSSPHNLDNQYYPGNSLPITRTSNMPYDPNQYILNNTFMNPSQPVIHEERSSKKVQFVQPIQEQTSSKNPLTTTQSWHEPSTTNNDLSVSTVRQEPVVTKHSVKRSALPKTNTSFAPAREEKPVYVGIDHRATLAERGQTTANKHHHKNTEKNNSDISNNHRTRSHTHHQHKHHESNDPSSSKNKSFEPFPVKLAGTHRSLTTTSTSTVIPNKQIQHTEQPILNDNEIKIFKTRGNHSSQSRHTELQSVVDNDIKPSRSRGTHSHQRQQQQQQPIAVRRNHSPLRSETTRRGEIKQQSTPIMTIPISQSQRQKQSNMSLPANITRTRI